MLRLSVLWLSELLQRLFPAGDWSQKKARLLASGIVPLAVVLPLAVSSAATETASKFTIEVSGDLLQHGGVVTVYPIPTAKDAISADGTSSIRVDDRYAEIQLRYPEEGTYTYRFQPVGDAGDGAHFGTQVLTIIGTLNGLGPEMTAGFKGAHASSGRIIRILSKAERSGEDDARWGNTQEYDDLPPADSRSARALVKVVTDPIRQFPLHCEGDGLMQACTVGEGDWTALEARWWRAIAEERLDRLNYHALRRCYDSSWLGGGTCRADPESNEPRYLYRH